MSSATVRREARGLARQCRLIQAQQFLEHGGRRVGTKQRADDRRRKTEDGCDPPYSNGGYQSHGGGS